MGGGRSRGDRPETRLGRVVLSLCPTLQTGLVADLIGRFARNFGGNAILYEPVDYQYLMQGHAMAGRACRGSALSSGASAATS